MAEMHEYLYDPEAKRLLPDSVRARIGDVRKRVRRRLYDGYRGAGDTREAVDAAVKSGHLDKKSMPPEHLARLAELGAHPSAGSWTIGRENAREEPLVTDDFLLVSGTVAAEAIPAAEFWNVPEGFSGPSDYHGTVGAMLLQRKKEIFINVGGYAWKSTDGKDTYESRITADMNGDFRMERIRVSPDAVIDPFGKPVHYRPALESDRELVAPSYGVEPTVLAAALKYVDQEKIDVPCLRDRCKAIKEFLAGTAQKIGPYGDFGKERDIDAAKRIMWTYAHPMGELGEGDFFWSLGGHYGGSYKIHIDDKRRMTFTFDKEDMHTQPMRESLVLHFTPDDMEHVIMGLFAQTQAGLGRTNAGQLADILEYRYSPEFNDDMARIREMFERK